MLLSNLAKKIVFIPSITKTEFQEFGNLYIFWISGPFGLIKYTIPKRLKIKLNSTSLLLRPTFVQKNWKFYNVYNNNIKKNTSKFSGNISTKLTQLMIGSSVGYKKHLRLRGVGYKFTLENRNLITDVGYTHLLYKKLYSEMLVKFSRKSTVFRAKSKDIVRLTGFMSSLRSLKKPDVYKGKGIRYLKENIIYKEGKKKKS